MCGLNAGDAHIGYFGSVDAIADAKAEILEGAGPSTLFVGNADDPRVMARARRIRRAGGHVRHRRTGRREGHQRRGPRAGGTQCTLVTRHGDDRCRCRCSAAAIWRTCSAATAVAIEMGVPLDDGRRRARPTLAPGRRRGEVAGSRQGVMVVDDTYNSSPSALTRALEMLSGHRPAGGGWRCSARCWSWAISAIDLHDECGRAAAAAGISTCW